MLIRKVNNEDRTMNKQELSWTHTLIVFCVLFFSVSGLPGCTPQSQLTITQLQEYKNALIAAGIENGCSCVHQCDMINQPNGTVLDCVDKDPLEVVSLQDPRDPPGAPPVEVHIRCYCRCGPIGSAPCTWDDSRVSWPSPVDPGPGEEGP